MTEKPFYNMFPVLYWHQRNKYNPIRFVLGDSYLSKKIPHKLLDTRDITIEPSGDYTAVKHLNNLLK